jgi:vancomycin resistance protein VanJ
VAVATKAPQLSHDDYTLLPGRGRRTLHVTVRIKGHFLHIWCVHYGTNMPGAKGRGRIAYLRGSAHSRALQTERLLGVVGYDSTIIAGDFNTPPRGLAYRAMTDRFENAFGAGNGFGYTYRSTLPVLRVDHIFMSPDLHPVHTYTVGTTASDHLPVVSDIEL